jgi:vacuolar-type H+-ATPase subunit H
MAFGLPPSESDEVFSGDDREEDLSQAESNLSSLNESLWQENSEELSMEAESILRSLNYPSKEISLKKPHVTVSCCFKAFC